MKNLFNVDTNEIKRIISLHEQSTKKQYLNVINEQTTLTEDDLVELKCLSINGNDNKIIGPATFVSIRKITKDIDRMELKRSGNLPSLNFYDDGSNTEVVTVEPIYSPEIKSLLGITGDGRVIVHRQSSGAKYYCRVNGTPSRNWLDFFSEHNITAQ